MKRHKLELLAPASNGDVAMQAILHGADAIYIGATSHGARKNASNTIEEIERVVDFTHQYRAKVYVTVNTLVYESEIRTVETLCHDLYRAGVDALIVQDMGLLRMKIPPIALHASTQCDIRTPEKALFLQSVGFSQLVLARELTLKEIKDITGAVSIPVECFVHGALCVSYSGRCQASSALTGRSGNRGECAQICRLPYTLTDSGGKIIVKDKYLLSLKDFLASDSLKDLINAGISSFKIEGRLKEKGYVKNITSWYSRKLDEIIADSPEKYMRSSFGTISYKFNPDPNKSFNRGFTDYFLTSRHPMEIASLITPKSMGEKITDISHLNNGDGISFIDREGNFSGVNVNRIVGKRIIPSRPVEIPKNSQIYRTSDIKWDKTMNGETAQRKIGVDITLENNRIKAFDERGVEVQISLGIPREKANKPMDYRQVFEKMGDTCYYLKNFESKIDPFIFFRLSELTSLRRDLMHLLDNANSATYPFEYRKTENIEAKYITDKLDYRDNVSNSLAKEFYSDHGVINIEEATEISGKAKIPGAKIMTTRYCLLRELGLCKRGGRGNNGSFKEPLYIANGNKRFRLSFDCKRCEMSVHTDKI